MRRRTVLKGVGGVAGASGLAGCLGSFDGSTPSSTKTPGDGQAVSPTDTAFEVRNRACGDSDNTARVTFDGGDVAVEGVIGGRDTCDTAAAATTMESGVLVLTVEVVQELSTETMSCAQCLTDISYAFTATFPNEGPRRVRVLHRSPDGESTVTTVDRP